MAPGFAPPLKLQARTSNTAAGKPINLDHFWLRGIMRRFPFGLRVCKASSSAENKSWPPASFPHKGLVG
jgi:hypothetical protein